MAITSDRAWQRETVPPSLARLGERLREHFEVPAVNVGFKGDEDHRRGYHRSRQFLFESGYASNRRYSVTEHGNRPGDGGDPTWVCAMDVTLPHDELVAACRRLDVAVRAGRLEKVAEWYGNTGGDNRVDGYDNIVNAISSSDPSHLWHLHLSFLRSRAGEDHSDVYAVLTGTAEEEDDMDAKSFVALLRDPAVRLEMQNIVKESRFGFDLTADGKGWSIGQALATLMKAPPGGSRG